MGLLLLALNILIGDRAKCLGMIFGVAFATLLIVQQSAIFVGLLARAGAAVRDVQEADLWVMDPSVQTVDEPRPMRDTVLARVRGVEGVAWAVPLFRGAATLRTPDGRQVSVTVVGVDDATTIGAPLQLVLGQRASLRAPDAVFVDVEGYARLFPERVPVLGAELELNDQRAVVRGITLSSPSFAGVPVVVTRVSQALEYTNNGRNTLSFVLARAADGADLEVVAASIAAATGQRVLTRDAFERVSRDYVIGNTGIPVSIGTTVVLGILVGVAIVALTFSIFVAENRREFGALRAMGVGDGQLVGMIAAQAFVVGTLGYLLGLGVAAAFFLLAATNVPTFRGFYLPWEVAALTAVLVVAIMAIAAALSLRRLLAIDPAIVFRS